MVKVFKACKGGGKTGRLEENIPMSLEPGYEPAARAAAGSPHPFSGSGNQPEFSRCQYFVHEQKEIERYNQRLHNEATCSN